MENTQIQSKEEFNKKLETIVEAEQKGWQKNIKDMIKLVRSKDPEDMLEGQALAISYRMTLVEKNHYYLSLLAKEEKIYKRLKAKRTCIYLTGRQLDGSAVSAADVRNPLIANQKISGSQRDLVISGELADFEESMQIIENALSFNQEVIKTIDSYQYMVKNRLDLFNILK